MRSLNLLLIAILLFTEGFSQVNGTCGINVSFDYSINGNTVSFFNTTTSVLPDVSISHVNWSFGDGLSSNEYNPVHAYSSVCNLNCCLTVYADSAGFPSQFCSYNTNCIEVNFGTPTLTVNLTATEDLANESYGLSALVTGGNGEYSYEWQLDGQQISNQPENITISYSQLPEYYNSVSCCVFDQSGCMSCANYSLVNPNIECDINLNTSVDGSLVTFTPEIFYDGELQTVWFGYISGPSNYLIEAFPNNTYEYYNNTLGTHEYCFNMYSGTLINFPNCMVEACESIEITELTTDCNPNFTVSNSQYNYAFNNSSIGNISAVAWYLNGNLVSNLSNYYAELTPGTYEMTLEVSNPFIGCQQTTSQTVVVPEPVHFCGHVYNDENFNGIEDADEMVTADTLTMVWNGNYIPVTNGSFDVYLYPDESCLLFGFEDSTHQITDTGGLEYCDVFGINLNLTTGEQYCPMTFGIHIPQGTICGTYYNDSNGNGTMDASEIPIPYGQIQIQGYTTTTTIYTDEDGYYCINIPIGQYFILSPIYAVNPLASHSPESYGYWLMNVDETITVNFGMYEVIGAVDLGIIQTALGSPVPGFQINYQTIIHNYSNLTCEASVSLNYDNLQIYFNSSDGGVNDDIQNTVTWNIIMDPFEVITLSSSFYNSTQMILGNIITVASSIQPACNETDISLTNNSYELSQTIIGSYDPNNKLALPIGLGPEGNIPPETPKLFYTINFQNTGTAPAHTVVITDDIDSDLNLNSVQLHYTSHSAQMLISGSTILWTFNNIMLPDSFSNEPASHGQIVYSINPQSNLSGGTEINNTAYIYFDFNEPVITNTTLHTIDISLNEEQIEKNIPVSFYPNPATDFVHVNLPYESDVQVTDINGRILMKKLFRAQQIVLDISEWSQGVYLFKIVSKEAGTSALIIKQ